MSIQAARTQAAQLHGNLIAHATRREETASTHQQQQSLGSPLPYVVAWAVLQRPQQRWDELWQQPLFAQPPPCTLVGKHIAGHAGSQHATRPLKRSTDRGPRVQGGTTYQDRGPRQGMLRASFERPCLMIMAL
jgi:hypothetical protein